MAFIELGDVIRRAGSKRKYRIVDVDRDEDRIRIGYYDRDGTWVSRWIDNSDDLEVIDEYDSGKFQAPDGFKFDPPKDRFKPAEDWEPEDDSDDDGDYAHS